MQGHSPIAKRCASSTRIHSRSVDRSSWPESDKSRGRTGKAPETESAVDKRRGVLPRTHNLSHRDCSKCAVQARAHLAGRRPSDCEVDIPRLRAKPH